MSGGFSFPPPPPPPPRSGSNGATEQRQAQSRGGGSIGQRSRGDRLHGRGNSNRGSHPQRHFGSNRSTHNDHAYPSGAYLNPAFTNSQSSQRQWSAPIHQATIPQQQPSDHYQNSPVSESFPRTLAGHKRKLEVLRGPVKQDEAAIPVMPTMPGFGQPVSSVSQKKVPNSARSSSRDEDAETLLVRAPRLLGLTPVLQDPVYSSSDSDVGYANDIDEEAEYAELGDKLTFEHNGEVMVLNSQADLAAWRKARQKNWPTKTRVDEKEEERRKTGVERRRLLSASTMLSRYIAGDMNVQTQTQPRLSGPPQQVQISSVEKHSTVTTECRSLTEAKRAKAALDEQSRTLEQLRKKVAESAAKNRHARNQLEHAKTAGTDFSQQHVAAEEGSSTIPPDTATRKEKESNRSSGEADHRSASDDVSSESSDSLSSSDSEDSKPEEVSSKPQSTVRQKSRSICRYFAASGSCRDGHGCKFLHERPSDHSQLQNGNLLKPSVPSAREKRQRFQKDEVDDKKTIFTRLVEQEENQETLLALQVIKYLGSIDFFIAE